jgi:putative ABC transport system substrate-binding protein
MTGLLGSQLVAAAVVAQPARRLTIGVLVVGIPGSDRFWRLFRPLLREMGYVEGQNVGFEFRSDEGQSSRLPELAAELVRLKVDMIVTWFTPAATAAKQATSEIPIVMALAGDPVATGLVQSLSRPGGNVTGVGGLTPELASKTVEFMRELLPGGRRLTIMANAPDPFSRPFVDQTRAAAAAAGFDADVAMVEKVDDLEAYFAAAKAKQPDAVVVQPSLPSNRTAQLSLKYGLPAACSLRSFADQGGLMSYWFAEAAIYRSAATIVDRIFKGAKPADLPVERPATFELVINAKTAKTLQLDIPPTLLARADEVIE